MPSADVDSACTSGKHTMSAPEKPMSRIMPSTRRLRRMAATRLLAVDARKPTPAARQIRPNTSVVELSSILTFSISSARV